MAVVTMNRPLLKAILFAVILVIAFCLYTFASLLIAISLSSPHGMGASLMPYIRVLTVAVVLGTVIFTYFAIGLLPIKLKRPGRLALAIAIPWFVMLIRFNLDPPNHRNCETYTKEMNGGTRVFQGKDFNIVLCGLSDLGPYNLAFNDEVRLQVFSMEGELLAIRYFEPLIGMGDFGLHLKYGNDYLTYETRDEGPSKKIAMPPSKWEWVRARLPRPWPFL